MDFFLGNYQITPNEGLDLEKSPFSPSADKKYIAVNNRYYLTFFAIYCNFFLFNFSCQ